MAEVGVGCCVAFCCTGGGVGSGGGGVSRGGVCDSVEDDLVVFDGTELARDLVRDRSPFHRPTTCRCGFGGALESHDSSGATWVNVVSA